MGKLSIVAYQKVNSFLVKSKELVSMEIEPNLENLGVKVSAFAKRVITDAIYILLIGALCDEEKSESVSLELTIIVGRTNLFFHRDINIENNAEDLISELRNKICTLDVEIRKAIYFQIIECYQPEGD